MNHMVVTSHPAYDAMVQKAFAIFTSPEYQASSSTAEEIAEMVYQAATDGKDQLRYVADADANAAYAQRLQLGAEAAAKRRGSNSSARRGCPDGLTGSWRGV